MLAVMALAVPAPAVAAPSITEYNSGLSANPLLNGIAAGADGNIWFAEGQGSGKIGRISTSGTITEFTTGLTRPPEGIAAGPDGNVWFTASNGGDRIGLITPAGSISEFSAGLTPNSQPSSLVAGPDGNLWFTERNNAAIGRVTTAGTITEFTTGISPSSVPESIALGSDGALWFTEAADPGRIGRITTAGVVTEYSVGLTPNSQPDQIAAGPDGALWFTEANNPGRIGRISTSGVITEYSTGLTINGQPSGIAAGADGSIWFTEQGGTGAIGRISPLGTITEFTTGLTSSSDPLHITLGPDNAMWFTEHSTPGAVGRITIGPRAGSVDVSVGAHAATLTAAINPHAQASTYWFEYGPTNAYGTQTTAASAGSGNAMVPRNRQISGLDAATTYYVRAAAANDSGTSYGPETTFTTAADPVPGGSGPVSSPGAPGGASPTNPAPQLGRSFVGDVVTGPVLVQVPGGKNFVPAGKLKTLPTGSVIDATRGKIDLTTALPGRKFQKGTFWGGRFRVSYGPNGLVILTLVGRPDCGSGQARLSARRRAVKLWGQDHGGRFRTQGRHGTATVRGTKWLTSDRCDGTLVKVVEGSVLVRTRATGKHVMLGAGGSYLARPKAARAKRS
jgi:streptogramin lyase